jgi:DNA ligase-associated metallophosphoesterase
MTDVTTAPRDAALDVAGEQMILMAEHALYWPAATTLFVADAHFGKAATFRAGGIFVPRGTTSAAVSRIDAALVRTGATRLIFLGDLLHAKEGRSPETLRVVGEWRASHPSLDVVLVRGNHDRGAGDPPDSLGISCVEAPMIAGSFAFTHHPRPIDGRYVFAGHIHPAVRLRGPGRQFERLACFWIRPTIMVLPAFGDFTGLGDIELENGDRVFAVADGQVVPVDVSVAAR